MQLSWLRRARTFDKAAWMSGSIVLCNSLLITFLDGLTSVTLQYWGVHSLPSSPSYFYEIIQKKILEALPCKPTLLIAGLMWTCYVPGFPISLSARLSDNPECRIDLNSWQISDLEIINYFPSPGLWCLATHGSHNSECAESPWPGKSWCDIVILSQVPHSHYGVFGNVVI